MTPGAADRGFSLVEMVVALALLGLVTAIVWPLMSRPHTANALRSVAVQMAAELRLARTAAVSSARETIFELDVERRLFSGQGGGGPKSLPRDITAQMTTPPEEQRAPSRASIRFRPDGSASGGVITLAAHGRTVDIRIDSWTGAAHVVWRQ